MVRCSICLDNDEAFGVLRCGHVFGIACITQQFEFRRECPKCRTAAAPEDIRRIFLEDNDSGAPGNLPPQKSLADMSTHLATMETVIKCAEQVNVDSTEAEITGLVQAAERVVVQFDDFQTQFGEVLGQLNYALGSLRNRLKYARHLTATREELAKALQTIDTRNEEIEHHVQQKAQLSCESTAAAEDSIRLAKRNQQWLEKYDRLKKRFHAMERHHGALHKDHEKRLSDVKKVLSEKDGKLVRYKKKLIAHRQEMSRTFARAREDGRFNMDEDELSLVTGMPGGFPSGRQMSHLHTAALTKGTISEDGDFSADEEMSDCEEAVLTRYGPIEHGRGLQLSPGSSKYDPARRSTVTPAPKPKMAEVSRGWLKGCLNLSLGIQHR